MNFGTRTDEAESRRIIDRAIERGIRVLDTANVYGDGKSEAIIGRALSERRGDVKLATKCGLFRRGGRSEGLSATAIRTALDESLARLNVGSVDVYYFHAPDPATPFEESLAAVDAEVRAGRVGKLGLSNFAAWKVLEMKQIAEARGWACPAIAQQLYNLVIRQLDIEYWAFAARHPIHTTVYNPLGGGLLAREPNHEGSQSEARFSRNPIYRKRYGSDRMAEVATAYSALAHDEGMSLLEFAYAWLAERPGVDSILVGPATVAHLDAAIDAVDRPLSEEARVRVDALHRDLAGTDASYAR